MSEPRSPAAGRRSIPALVLVLAAAAAALGAGLSPEPVVPGGAVPLVALAALFAAAEMCVVHVHLRRQAQTFSLSEVPMVLGLLFVSPLALLLARLSGSAVALVVHRRQPAIKVAFNLALFAIETMLAARVFRAGIGGADALSPRGWLAAGGALTLNLLLGSVVIGLAIAASEGVRPTALLSRVAATGVVMTVLAADLGLLAAIVVRAEPTAWVLLLLGFTVAGFAVRSHARLRSRYRSLEHAYDFTTEAAASLESGGGFTPILDRACELLRAGWAELTFLDDDGNAIVVRSREGVASVATGEEAQACLASRLEALGESTSTLLVTRRAGARRDDAVVAYLPAVVAPGTFAVGDRLGTVEPFDDGDRRLVETLATHAAVALRNRRLLDRLHAEMLEREHRAVHDGLTGLPNRVGIDAELARVLAARDHDDVVGVLLIDLNRFKEVNDTLGHHQGDQLLVEVAARLRSAVPGDAFVGRLGGDEFAVLLAGATTAADIERVARALVVALSEPFMLADLAVEVGGSIGVALSPEHGQDGAGLLQRADVAMYAAKDRGSGVELYASTIDRNSPDRLALVAELRSAIEREELTVEYQAVVDLTTGAPIGAEALTRWYHPRRGQVPPSVFVPIAESTGLIHELTEFVLGRALRQVRDWRAEGLDLSVSVNLSVRDLIDDLPGMLGALLDELQVPAHALTLEITESTIMSEPHRTIGLVRRLSGMGVRISIDDFGTGYSSLSQLHRLPVDEVKIDRSFVQAMTGEGGDPSIVRAIVDLARNLGLQTIAEGVEDGPTWQLLRALGCHGAQGFFIVRPRTPAQLARWFRERKEELAAMQALVPDVGPLTLSRSPSPAS